MADLGNEVSILLKLWGFEGLIPTFAEHEIDIGALCMLTADHLRELIPKIGRRAIFMKKLEEYREQVKLSSTGYLLDTPKEVQSSSAETLTNTPAGSTISENYIDEFDVCCEDTSVNNVKPEGGIAEYSINVPETSGSIPVKIQEPFTSQNILDILQGSGSGRFVLGTYETGKSLNRKTRGLLVDIIINHLLQNPNVRLRNDQFESIAESIVSIFQTESVSVYYIPPVKKRDSRVNKSCISKGKLVDKYRNKFRELRSVGILGSVSRTIGLSEKSAIDVDTTISDEQENSKSWLANSCEPWPEVLKHWKNTWSMRQEQNLKSDGSTVQHFIKDWPVLQHSLGYTLIESDFEQAHPESVFELLTQWETFFQNLRSLKSGSTDVNYMKLVSLLDGANLSDDSKHTVQIMLLPYMQPPPGRIRSVRKQWKPSVLESQEGIICHAKIPGDINRLKYNKVQKMQNIGLTVQPYIIVVGPSVTEIQSCYVNIDSTLYKMTSVLKSLDICFKAFHVLNASYPPESEHIWLLIQLAIYHITTKWDSKIPRVFEALSALQCIQ